MIIDLQRRLAQIGRIRLGRQVETKRGGKRPAALDTFRLTSHDRDRIVEAANLYGGTVTKWDESPSGIPQWEVITKADKLPVVVPPSAMALSQHYELWSGGGCQRRCDGVTELISEEPCKCDPENRQCEIHTRLSLMLRDLSGLGVWRVDTQGFYAAVELQGAVEVIELAAGKGQMLPATLRLDQRVIKREGEGTKRFVVPVLDIEVSPAQLLMGTVAVEPSSPQKALTPVPAAEEKPASIADQVSAAEEIPSRRRAKAIPSTGLAPRTAAQARTRARGHDNPNDAADEDHGGDDPEQGGGATPQPGEDVTPAGQLPDVCPNCEMVNSVEGTATGWWCANCHITDLEAYDKGLGGWVVTGPSGEKQITGWGKAEGDAPRMVTGGQLTKLGILITEKGYEKTA